ncbi:unnamed protein product, partial [marine sediment metagenome]
MNKLRIAKFILGFLSILVLIGGAFWAYLLFFGGRVLRGITIVIEEFVAQSSVLMLALCITVTILLMKLLAARRVKHPKQYY